MKQSFVIVAFLLACAAGASIVSSTHFGFAHLQESKHGEPIKQELNKREIGDCSWLKTSSDCYFQIYECDDNCTCVQNAFDCVLEGIRQGICSFSSYDCDESKEELKDTCTLNCVDIYKTQEDICPYSSETAFSGMKPQDVELTGNCSRYSGNTCCSEENTNYETLVTGNITGQCSELMEELGCIVCSPDAWKYSYATKEVQEGGGSITSWGRSICVETCKAIFSLCKGGEFQGKDVESYTIGQIEFWCLLMQNGLVENIDVEECYQSELAVVDVNGAFMVAAHIPMVTFLVTMLLHTFWA